MLRALAFVALAGALALPVASADSLLDSLPVPLPQPGDATDIAAGASENVLRTGANATFEAMGNGYVIGRSVGDPLAQNADNILVPMCGGCGQMGNGFGMMADLTGEFVFLAGDEAQQHTTSILDEAFGFLRILV